uniref:Uncharacterized protein n=1 Tax=Methylophaga nitratireducenticrescens TaxID=754476 RepID=I1XLR9_METNJ
MPAFAGSLPKGSFTSKTEQAEKKPLKSGVSGNPENPTLGL